MGLRTGSCGAPFSQKIQALMPTTHIQGLEPSLWTAMSENPASDMSSDSLSGVYRFMPSIILEYLTEASSSPVDSLVTAKVPRCAVSCRRL